MKKHTLSIIFIMMSLMACETVVDIDIPLGKRQLAIQSFFHPDSTWRVYVSHSNHILDIGYYRHIEDASVVLFEDGQELGTLGWNPEFEYYSSENLSPKPGKTYSVEVSAPGYEAVNASSYVPGFVPVKSIVIDTSHVIEHSEYQRYYKATVIFDDPAEDNLYEFGITAKRISQRSYRYFDGTGYRDSVVIDTTFQNIYIHTVDPAQETDYWSGALLFDDKKFNGAEYTLEMLISESLLKDSEYWGIKTVSLWLTCILKNITEEKYLFEKTLAIQRSVEGDPFAEPMPVFNNINNGLGIFAGYQQDARVFKIK